MASGEYPIRIVTPNVQLAVTSTLVTTIGDLTLPIPPTMTDEAFKRSQPKVTLGPKGLSSCIKIGSYAQLSLLQWAVNPYLSSRPVKSPLLRISSAIQADEVVLSGLSSISNAARSSNTYKLPGVPAYTLSIQFSSPQNFNFDAAINYTSKARSKGNYTIPVCTQYNGVAYVPCHGCNISTYTNYNVTYSCYDISQVCPTTIVRRRLEGLNEEDDTEDPEIDGNIESAMDDIYSRHLLSTNDDGDATAASPTTYGTLVQSIGAELSNVLSSNPFVRPSVAVLVFVGCLSGFICLMLLCLLKQDDEEKTAKNYVKADIYAKARKLLEEDIRDGRSGDQSVNYQEHLTQCKGETVTGTGTGIVRKILRMSSMGKGTSFGMKSNSPPKQSEPFDESLQPSVLKDAQNNSENERDSGSGSCTDSDDDDLNDGKSHEKEAAIIEFLHILFPGRAIFKERSNFFQIVAVNHDYFKMFGGSTMTRSRTIRFLELVVVVLVTLFVDTVFFSVFYPANQCGFNTDQVNECR
jgi:hypothetical protein